MRALDCCVDSDGYQPMRVLSTQLTRKLVEGFRPYVEDGRILPLMLDSGAYSIHTGTAKPISVDSYISYINEVDRILDFAVELDRIPGVYKEPKQLSDYLVSASESFEVFKYMYERLNSPHKLMYAHHQGESFEHLNDVLSWYSKGKGGSVAAIGISGAVDGGDKSLHKYLEDCMKVVQNSKNPNVWVHILGTSSLQSRFICGAHSTDSTTALREACCGKVVIPGSKRWYVGNRSNILKEHQNVIRHGGESTKEKLREYLEPLHLSMEQIQDDQWARIAFNMYYLDRDFRDIPITGKLNRPTNYNLLDFED